jgi:hypothetical protein
MAFGEVVTGGNGHTVSPSAAPGYWTIRDAAGRIAGHARGEGAAWGVAVAMAKARGRHG